MKAYNDYDTKGERRHSRVQNNSKMGMSGRSVKTLVVDRPVENRVRGHMNKLRKARRK